MLELTPQEALDYNKCGHGNMDAERCRECREFGIPTGQVFYLKWADECPIKEVGPHTEDYEPPCVGLPWGSQPAQPPPTCDPTAMDDDALVASDSEGRVASCAAGLAEYAGVCSMDMFRDGGAPSGWFMRTCPVSCKLCG